MDTQEILTEILKLPPESQKQVLDSLTHSIGLQQPAPQPISEDEAERILAAQGIIRLPPNASDYTDEDEDFEPVEFSGKPLSEMIIEERRLAITAAPIVLISADDALNAAAMLEGLSVDNPNLHP